MVLPLKRRWLQCKLHPLTRYSQFADNCREEFTQSPLKPPSHFLPIISGLPCLFLLFGSPLRRLSVSPFTGYSASTIRWTDAGKLSADVGPAVCQHRLNVSCSLSGVGNRIIYKVITGFTWNFHQGCVSAKGQSIYFWDDPDYDKDPDYYPDHAAEVCKLSLTIWLYLLFVLASWKVISTRKIS